MKNLFIVVSRTLIFVFGFILQIQFTYAQSSSQKFYEGYFNNRIKPKCVIPVQRRGIIFNNTEFGKYTYCFTADTTSLRSTCDSKVIDALLLKKANEVCDVIAKEPKTPAAGAQSGATSSAGTSTGQTGGSIGGGAAGGGGSTASGGAQQQAAFGGTATGTVRFCGVQGCGGGPAPEPKYTWQIPVAAPNVYSADRFGNMGLGFEDGKQFDNQFEQPTLKCDASNEGQMIAMDFGYKQNYAVMCVSDQTVSSPQAAELIKKIKAADVKTLSPVYEGVTKPKYGWVETQAAEELRPGANPRVCWGLPLCLETDRLGDTFDPGPGCAKVKCVRLDPGGPIRGGKAKDIKKDGAKADSGSGFTTKDAKVLPGPGPDDKKVEPQQLIDSDGTAPGGGTGGE